MSSKSSTLWLVIILAAIVVVLSWLVMTGRHNRELERLYREINSLNQQLEELEKEKQVVEEQLKELSLPASASAQPEPGATPSGVIESGGS